MQSVSQEHNIEAMPSFLFFKDGKEIDRVVGARKEDLAAKITQHGGAPLTASAWSPSLYYVVLCCCAQGL